MVSKNDIHIVLVEDNPGDAYLIQHLLQGIGAFQCKTFTTLKATAGYLTQTKTGTTPPKPDVILLDLSLPDSHGLETLTCLRATAPTIPIVILTILDDDGIATAALRQGAQDYLIKGEITRDNLIRSLRYGIERTHLIQRIQESEVQLRQTNTELARVARLKDEFLANMSHELRTPLNAILGMTESLQEHVFGELNPKQIEAIQTIENSGSHLLELINDILDVAKIESGRIELDRLPTEVAALCQESLALIKQQALNKNIQVEMPLPSNLPDLLVDARRIRQVLVNLLHNAVKFTPEGGRITLNVQLFATSKSPREY